MTLTLVKNLSFVFALGLIFLAAPFMVSAQDSLSLSVSPTLYEMTASPGQDWKSSLRVVNHNDYEIRVYLEVVNFAPDGEAGQGDFVQLPTGDEAEGLTVGEWIQFDKNEITIPPEQTAELSLNITVPEGAAPGGHYAAVFVGTKPPETEVDKPIVQTAQVVTSLIFLRVNGDVIENGNIRSFRALNWLLEKPEADFELRFENKGNVFLQPQGEIKIYNMWGQVRGSVPVNRDTMFGLVPQDSIRKFTFGWKGDWSITDMGRYTAVATLAYGAESRQFASSEATFWVIPWRAVLGVMVVILTFVLFVTWAIKAYVRRMLTLAGVAPTTASRVVNAEKLYEREVSVVSPIKAGVLDLRTRFNRSSTLTDKAGAVGQFVRSYRLFFVALFVFLFFVGLVVWFVQNASTESRNFEVTVDGSDSSMTISSEQLEYESRKNQVPAASSTEPVSVKINIVNRSGVPGAAATARIKLEDAGIQVNELSADLSDTQHNTVVVYNEDFVDTALELSAQLDNALLSSFAGDPEDGVAIVVYIGEDYAGAIE